MITAEVVIATTTVIGIMAAALLHGVSGMGFALAAVPLLTVLLGPHDGIRMGLALGLLVSVFALVGTWRWVQWRVAALLLAPGAVVIPLGAWIVTVLEPAVLSIVMGSLVIALVIVAAAVRTASIHSAAPQHRTAATIGVGAIAAAVHVSSALSAPLLTAYAIRVGWEPKRFAATAQIVFIGYNAAALVFLGLDFVALGPAWLLVLPLAIGLPLGLLVRRLISDRVATVILSVVAIAGGIAAIVKGATMLAGT